MAKVSTTRRPKDPTIEPSGGENFSASPQVIGTTEEIVNALNSYRFEAQEARRAGMNPRDDKWKENLDLYWNRYDFGAKANWQAKEVLPEVPGFVDRFAAALKEALVSTPEGFYSVSDPADAEDDVAQAVKRMTDVWLSRAGRNQVGQLLPFAAVFEEQMKLGSLMATSSVTTWKTDVKPGRVAVETVDPRMIWLDPTNRNLYRIRRSEMDRHELPAMMKMKDAKGEEIFNIEEISKLVSHLTQEAATEREAMVGHGAQISSGRKVITLDEYIATVVNSTGDVIADRALMVMANERFLVRGPEKNPFWHGKDWITFAPLVTAPMSVYGRSYMEDFGSIAKTFMELTNMILDAVHTSSMNAFAVIPGMLLNPQQLADGLVPNKAFLLEDGMKASDFASAIELGNLSPDAYRVWQTMKSELTEAAGINEIGLGQFAPKGRTSATEVMETQQSSSALIRSVAQTVETRWLDPTLDLVWKTGVQHVDANDTMMAEAAGPELFEALMSRRKELVQRPFTFQARGISMTIQKSQMLKTLVSLLSVVASNELLLAEFVKVVDMQLLVKKLFELSNIDLTTLQASQREQMIRSVTDPMQQVQQSVAGVQGEASPQGQGMVQDLAQGMGIAR